MANNEGFSPLDPLGPEYGDINQPRLDPISMQPFEGDRIKMPEINFPKAFQPIMPAAGSLDYQGQNIKRNMVGAPPNKPRMNTNGMSAQEKKASINEYITNLVKSNQTKDSYSKLYSYNAGSSGNSFYKRYKAYGAEIFDKVGFSPTRDNEANFNAQTTVADDWKRMMTHSFVPLFNRGFVSGYKSLGKMLKGDFTSGDVEDARLYEEAAAIGQSSKKGILPFLSNTQMNFGYTAGIISSAIFEEIAGAVLAPATGGLSFLAATANNSRKIFKGIKGLNTITDGYTAVKTTLNTLNNSNTAKNYWNVLNKGLKTPLGKFINPIENTIDAFQTARKLDNIGNLALLAKTAGGFYRDVRSINMAVSEARLEAGMVENKVYDTLYNNFYQKNKTAPTNTEQYEMTKQSKEASLETFYTNAGLIYGTNKITFGNVMGPKGGLRNFIKSSTDDILDIAARQGEKNFGKYGKVIYDKAAKQFALEKNNLKTLAQSWYKNPGFKTAAKTVGYFKSNFSEGIQENLQEVIARANEKYYIESYQSPFLKSQLYSKAAINDTVINRKRDIFNTPFEAYTDELKKEVSSQGLETFASGFVMGIFGAPMNNAIPFLSTQWNRTFDKEAYSKWKDTKANVAKNMVDNLNKMSPKEFLSNRYYNAGSQDTLSIIKESGSKKEGLDSELESYINQVDTMLATNTSDLFIEKIESLKELTDEELINELKLEEDQFSDVNKYRARIDKSVNKLKNIQNAFNKVEELLPNPTSLPQEDDLDKDDKEFMHYSWKMAQKNFVYFNESYKDNITRINDIQKNYLKTPNLANLSNTEVSYLFDPFRLGDAINSMNLELISLKSSDPVINKNRINILSKKQETLREYQSAYEEFNQVFDRTKYITEIKAQLVSEKIEPTPEAIQERMEQEYGVEGDTTRQDNAVGKLKKAHENYLNAIAGTSDTILFKDELDESFEKLVDLYKLKQESKDVAKFANFIANPKGFYDTVLSNLKWMRGMYNTRAEYFTNLVNEQMNNAISNSLLNKLAEKNIYMSMDDFIELRDNGILPSEFYDESKKLAINKGTSRYRELIDEYVNPYLEIIKENAEPEIEQKNLNNTRKTFNDKMEAEIANLPKEERIVDEQVLVKEDGTSYSILEAYDVMPNGYYMNVEASDGKLFKTTLKFIKEDDKLYQFGEDDKFLPTKEEQSIEQINSLDELPISKITIFKIEVAPNPEDIENIRKKYAQKLAEEQEDFDASRPEVMQKSIDEILQLANLYESIVQTKTNYFIDGIKHNRMSNAIKSKVALFTSLKRTKVEELIDSTIGQSGFTADSLKAFMTDLENEYGDSSGFDQEVYKAIKEELDSIIPKQSSTDTKVDGDNSVNNQKEIDRINAITDSEKRKTAEIEFTMRNLFAGVGEAAVNKIKEYADRIISGKETREKAIQGLSKSFIEGIDSLLALERAPVSDRSEGSVALKAKINSLNNEISNLVSIRDTAKNQSVIDKQIKALQNKKQELEAELKQGQEKILSDEELKNYIVNTIDENTYENKRKGGTYLDTLTKNFLDGQDIVFNKDKISEEAFESLFGKDGFITDIRRRIESGELWVYAKDLIVASNNLIDDNNNMLEPVAGEIDFIFVDKEGKKFIVDLKSADARKWAQYKSDSGYGFNKRAENTLQQIGYANLIENTIAQKYGITILPVALEYEGNKITYASRPDIVLDIEKQPIGDPNEKSFNVTLDENIIIPIKDTDGTVVNLTAKEIMQKIIPVRTIKKTKGKPQPKQTTSTPAPIKQVNFTKEELDEIASYQDIAERLGAEYALNTFYSNVSPGMIADELVYFEKDDKTPNKLYNAIINVINEIGSYETNSSVLLSEVPKINSKYYALNTNFVEQYAEVMILDVNTDAQTITFKKTGKGKFTPQTMSLVDFMENFSSYTDIKAPSKKPKYEPTTGEQDDALENKTNVDEFLNSDISALEDVADDMSIEDAKKNLFDDLNC